MGCICRHGSHSCKCAGKSLGQFVDAPEAALFSCLTLRIYQRTAILFLPLQLGGRRPSAANQLVGLSFMRYVQPQEEEASPVDLNEIMSAFARNGAGWAADAPGGSVEPTSPEFNAYAYWSQPVFDAFAPPPKVVEAADQFADQHMATPRSRKKT